MTARFCSGNSWLVIKTASARIMLKKIFIVILQYNNSHDTIKCLNSVKELNYPNFEVIIIDNASEIKHIEAVRFFLKNQTTVNCKLKTANSNLGYSGGNNVGIKYALEHGADYVLILNNDTTVEKDLLTKLANTSESDPEIGIVGPAIDEGNKSVCGGKVEWLKPELQHLKREENMPDSRFQIPDSMIYVPGAAMLIKREVIEKICLLDERYFLYFEDVDYCLRAQRAGYKLSISPEILLGHTPSSTTSTLGAPLLLRYHYRNAHLFNWKNGQLWVKLVLPFWSIFIIIKQLTKISIGKNPEISKAILAGVVDFYKNRFGKINA